MSLNTRSTTSMRTIAPPIVRGIGIKAQKRLTRKRNIRIPNISSKIPI